MLEQSDNIAYHMLDYHFATTYGGDIATFYFSERFDLALDYANNILTPHDLIYAYRLIYKHQAEPSFRFLIDILRHTEGPAVFPQQDVSHKPGDFDCASADAGILWLEEEPIFYAVLLEGGGNHKRIMKELGDLFLEYMAEIKQIDESKTEAEAERATVNTIFAPVK